MDFTVFITVLSGVLTFVLGQMILKLVIEPVQECKKTIGKIAHTLIMRANLIANPGVGDKDVINSTSTELRALSSDLHSHLRLVPFYRQSARLFGLPTQQQMAQASSSLIGLSNGLSTVTEKIYEMNQSGVRKVCKALGIYYEDA
jgi:hypothetical protein